MKRRLSVAIALIGRPKVVYLDEPSTGAHPFSFPPMVRVESLRSRFQLGCKALCSLVEFRLIVEHSNSMRPPA